MLSITEFRKNVSNSAVTVTDLLRQALAIATKLGLHNDKYWIMCELKGYENSDALPKCRQEVFCRLYAETPRGGEIVNIPDPKLREILSYQNILFPLPDIEPLIVHPFV